MSVITIADRTVSMVGTGCWMSSMTSALAIWAIRTLRAILVALLLMTVVLATFSFPGMFRYERQQEGPADPTGWVLFVGIEVALVAVMTITASLWRLVGLVRADAIFTPAALRILSIIVTAALTVVAFFGVALVVVAITEDDPGAAVLFVTFGLIAATLTLSAFVVREVVRQQIVRQSHT